MSINNIYFCQEISKILPPLIYGYDDKLFNIYKGYLIKHVLRYVNIILRLKC